MLVSGIRHLRMTFMLQCNKMVDSNAGLQTNPTQNPFQEIHMSLTPEQVIAANKANLETLVGLTNKAFAGVEQLIELNLAAAKAAMADSQQ
ncbi:MAG: phasin family protein, partial [Limnohabitans sp.]